MKGSLHFGLIPANLFVPHESRPWNPLIARTFYRRGIIEEWGRGTLKMAELATSAGLGRPEIEGSGDCVMVCFRRGQFVPSQREVSDLTEQQRAILELLDQSDRSIISAERRNNTSRKPRTRSAGRGYHAAGLTTTRIGCSFTPSHTILATSCASWRCPMQWNNGH